MCICLRFVEISSISMKYIIGWKADANLTIDNLVTGGFVTGFKVLDTNACIGQ